MLKILLLTHPYEISLPSDESATRAAICYLAYRKLPFDIQYIRNADSCSPDSLLPLSIVNDLLITGYTSLCSRLKVYKQKNIIRDDSDKLISRNLKHTYFFWISNGFRNIMLYFTWSNDNIFDNFTKPRFMSSKPNFISSFMIKDKRDQYLFYLDSNGWKLKTQTNVIKELDAICSGIVELLDEGPFLFKRSHPGKIDTLIYGCWFVLYEHQDCFKLLRPIMIKYEQIFILANRVAEYCEQPRIIL